mgnify:CR=1 FL=1
MFSFLRSRSSDESDQGSVNKRLSRSLSSIFKRKNSFFRRRKKRESVGTTLAVGNETYQPGSIQSDETDDYDG